MERDFGRTQHLEENFDKGELPFAIKELRHTLPWPIDTEIKNIHIANYFGFPDYITPRFSHDGVDIQVPAGTPVSAICDLQLGYSDGPDERGVSNLVFKSDFGLIVRYIHLSPLSIPKYLQSNSWLESNPYVKVGDLVGEVGKWPKWGEPKKTGIPKDVQKVYGTSYDHLHLEIQYIPFPFKTNEFLWALMGEKNHINPLLLLKK